MANMAASLTLNGYFELEKIRINCRVMVSLSTKPIRSIKFTTSLVTNGFLFNASFIGLIPNIFAIEIATGVIRKMVVTLSRKAEKTAVTAKSKKNIFTILHLE